MFMQRCQRHRRKSSEPELVMSPGYGELAELLHEAALLEFSLEHGELPGEGAKKAGVELEKKERQGEMKGGEEREKQPVVKAEEEKKKHATMAKAHAKQEALASKSKSVFCNPLLRSKSVQKQDESVDTHPPPSLAITPIPEKEVVPADATAQDAEIKSPVQTSPRSLCSQPQDSMSASSEMSEDCDANSAYEAIDQLAKSKAGKSAASLIPLLNPMSFTLDVPIIQENNQLLSSPPELLSPKWSASLYVPSTSQFPPIFSAHPTSSFYTSIPQISENYTSSRALDSVGKDKLMSPDFTSPTGPHSKA
ncbi:hypothetical protein E4T56_gene15162 [Termitomyces sp. T112]|nr:hypothetical protein E4T56_gene15162 [Termitomyces sp. T112]